MQESQSSPMLPNSQILHLSSWSGALYRRNAGTQSLKIEGLNPALPRLGIPLASAGRAAHKPLIPK